MWICFTKRVPPHNLTIRNKEIERVNTFKLLGVYCQDNLKWNRHIEEITKKASRRLFHLRECKKAKLPVDVGITMYCSRIRPILEYASPIWGGISNYLEHEVERVQNRSMNILRIEAGETVEMLSNRRDLAAKREIEKIINDKNHPCQKHCQPKSNCNYNLRNARNFMITSGTKRHKTSFVPRALTFREMK